MNKNIFNLNTSRKSYLWAMFLPQILSIAVVLIFSMFYKDLETLSNSIPYLITVMLIAQVGFFIIIYNFKKNNAIKVKPLIKQKANEITLNNIIVCLAISIIAIIGLVHFVGLFNRLLGKIGYVPSESLLPNNTFGWFIVNVIISCVIPAVMEELLFRGIIFNGLKKLGFWSATALSAVMFMTVHLSLGSIVYPLIMGVVFCLIYKKTGNILYTIITHFCNNFIIKLVEYLNNVTGSNILGINFTARWQYLIVLLVAVIALVVIYLLIKYCLKNGKDKAMHTVESVTNSYIYKTEEIVDKNEFSNNKFKMVNTLLICGAFWLFMCIVSIV